MRADRSRKRFGFMSKSGGSRSAQGGAANGSAQSVADEARAVARRYDVVEKWQITLTLIRATKCIRGKLCKRVVKNRFALIFRFRFVPREQTGVGWGTWLRCESSLDRGSDRPQRARNARRYSAPGAIIPSRDNISRSDASGAHVLLTPEPRRFSRFRFVPREQIGVRCRTEL